VSAPRVQLARSLGFVAADLDRRGYAYSGLLRQAARALLEIDPDDPDGCPGCGRTIDQPPTGRRRIWCSEACRRRHRT
jgi:hypothetical protein